MTHQKAIHTTHLKPLQSALLKMREARQIIDQLSEEVATYLNQRNKNPFTSSVDPDSGYREFRLNVPVPPPENWGVKIGMAATQMRGALDSIVYDLSKEQNDNVGTSTQFPICSSAMQFHEKKSQRMIRFLLPRHRALIGSVQPFINFPGLAKHPLLQLQELSNLDKHRGIMLTVAPVEMIGINMSPEMSDEDRINALASGFMINRGIAQHGTLLSKLSPNSTTTPSAWLGLRFASLDPALSKCQVIQTLRDIFDCVNTIGRLIGHELDNPYPLRADSIAPLPTRSRIRRRR